MTKTKIRILTKRNSCVGTNLIIILTNNKLKYDTSFFFLLTMIGGEEY